MPYRSLDAQPTKETASLAQMDTDEDIAKTLLFVWATAAARFVIVCRRHEAFTADPLFATLLTFGMPTIVLAHLVREAIRSLTAAFAALVDFARRPA